METVTRQQLVGYQLTGSDISIDVVGKTFFDYKPRLFFMAHNKKRGKIVFFFSMDKLVSDTLPCG